jgi:hypothetical protein
VNWISPDPYAVQDESYEDELSNSMKKVHCSCRSTGVEGLSPEDNQLVALSNTITLVAQRCRSEVTRGRAYSLDRL